MMMIDMDFFSKISNESKQNSDCILFELTKENKLNENSNNDSSQDETQKQKINT